MLEAFFRAALAEVGFQDFFPLALSFEDELYGVAEGAVASGVRRDVVGLLLYFGAGVFDGDGQSRGAHGGQVDHVVADEGGFFRCDSCFFHDFLKACALVVDALANVFEFQVAGAEGDGFGDAFGDESGLDAGEAGEGDRGAIVGVEAFGFDQGLALEAESALSGALGGLLLRALIERTVCWMPAGAGKMKSLPSVRTPSTSKRRSLILRARAAGESLGIGREF